MSIEKFLESKGMHKNTIVKDVKGSHYLVKDIIVEYIEALHKENSDKIINA